VTQHGGEEDLPEEANREVFEDHEGSGHARDEASRRAERSAEGRLALKRSSQRTLRTGPVTTGPVRDLWFG
jgi:hypothetical protein